MKPQPAFRENRNPLRFSALEDEPWIEARAIPPAAPTSGRVSVLLKTSRGLKLKPSVPSHAPTLRFSALEDEPWIEAAAYQEAAREEQGFSALEDEPWIEACADRAAAKTDFEFQCS